MRACKQCGESIEGRPSGTRFCSSACRNRSHRGEAPRAAVVQLVETPAATRSVEAAVEADLATLSGVPATTIEAALILARAIDAGPESPAGLAVLVRELRQVLTDARSARSVEPDILDQLRARREARERDG